MIPSAILWIIGALFALGVLAAIFTWASVRKPDDYEPIENGDGE